MLENSRRIRQLVSESFFLQFLVWFTVTIAFMISAIIGLEIPKYYKLLDRGILTEGWVTDKKLQNHQVVRYSYNINGQIYSPEVLWDGGDILRFLHPKWPRTLDTVTIVPHFSRSMPGKNACRV